MDNCYVDQTLFGKTGTHEFRHKGMVPSISVHVEGVGSTAEIVYQWAVRQDIHDTPSSNLVSEGEVEVRVKAASITGCKAFRASDDPSKTRVLLHLHEDPCVVCHIKIASGLSDTEGAHALPTRLREKFMIATEHSFVFCAPRHAVCLSLSPVCMFAPALPTIRRKILPVHRKRHHAPSVILKKSSCSTLSSVLQILKPKRSVPVQPSIEYVVQKNVPLEKWSELAKRMDRVCMLKPGTLVTASKQPEERLGALYQLVTVRGSKMMGWLKLQQGTDHCEQTAPVLILKAV